MSEFVTSVNSTKFNLEIINENELNFGNQKISYELIELNYNNFLLKLGNKLYELTAEKINGDLFKVNVGGYDFEITVRTALQERAYKLLESASRHQAHQTNVKAPMPGLILKIKKNTGDRVVQGESVVILEAMKMENDLKAPASGIIEKILVTEGSPVEKGASLFSIV
jgi:biotin carboxyl carrier protein